MSCKKVGGGQGVKKMVIWDDFQGKAGVTRVSRGAKLLKIGVMSFMDDP